ncbi:MATE efflux family protein [Perilla frutescens var. frutescens]|nr:MATE efflux family protein [Perilla frutescens var. frutescens]
MVVSSGFLASVSIRDSNELGKRDARAAKFSILIAVLTSFSIGLVLLVLFLMFKKNAAYLFKKNVTSSRVFFTFEQHSTSSYR